jgi:hypothetical protein
MGPTTMTFSAACAKSSVQGMRKFRRQTTNRGRHQIRFGVRGRIAIGEDGVLCGQDDRVVDGEQRAERMVAVRSCFSRELDGLPGELLLNVS